MFEFFKWVFIKEALIHCVGCIGVALFYIGVALAISLLIEIHIDMIKNRRGRR